MHVQHGTCEWCSEGGGWLGFGVVSPVSGDGDGRQRWQAWWHFMVVVILAVVRHWHALWLAVVVVAIVVVGVFSGAGGPN